MNANANQPCASSTCACLVPAGESYCSEHCREAMEHPHDGADSESCRCGHPACASDPAADAGD